MELALAPIRFFFQLPIKFIIFCILVAIVIGQLSHALSKHASDAEVSRSCLEQKGPDLTYARGDNENRRIQLCLIPDPENEGKFLGMAIRVSEKIAGKFEEITAYVNWDIKTLTALVEYYEVDSGKYGFMVFISQVVKVLMGN